MKWNEKSGTLRQRGAAAVEMAIVLPLLLLVIGGIVDFGRTFMTEIVITNAAREGARAAVVGKPTDAALVQTRTLAAAPAVDPADLTIAIAGCGASGGGNATVTVAVPDFHWIFVGVAAAMVGGTLDDPDISSTAVMRCGG